MCMRIRVVKRLQSCVMALPLVIVNPAQVRHRQWSNNKQKE